MFAALVLGLFAYRTLLLSAFELPSLSALEGWLFRPSKLPVLGVAAASLWLAFRRLPRWRGLAPRFSASAFVGWSAVAGAFFVWGQLTRSVDFFLPALAASGLALLGAARGWPGCRVGALPALVLLLGLQIPNPLRAELVWHLQLSSAAGAAWLVQLTGAEVTRSGVLLLRPETSFHVIDACSGLAAIQVLLLTSIAIRELFADAGPRVWAVVALAPVLALLLNMVRIAIIALSPDPQALAGPEGDHTLQGVAVLAAGTAILYALGWSLGREVQPSEAARRPLDPAPAGAGASSARVAFSLPAAFSPPAAFSLMAVLALLSLAVSPFSLPARQLNSSGLEFPRERAGWTSRDLEVNTSFTGPLLAGERLYRRYEEAEGRRTDGAVEIFVAYEVGRFLTSGRLLSSKFLQPGPEWTVEESRPVQLWSLGREGILTVAKRTHGEERAVLYTWRLRDGGPWIEFWRSLFALESSPWRRPARRGVVQLVAFAVHDGPLVIDRAKQQLDRFVATYRSELEAL